MVPLWTLDTAVDMLEFIHACRDFLAECSVVIYPHPTFPEKTVADLRNSLNKDINEIEMASESFFAGLENADLVIYHGTTACLDALAQGLPVIDVEFDDFISPDPLFDFFDFKWTAGEPEELQDALYEINSLSDADYHSRQKTGFEFMRKYYYPVTESGMKNFLSL